MKNIRNDQFIEILERLPAESSVKTSTIDAFSSQEDKESLATDIKERLNKTGVHIVIFLIEV